MGRYKAPSSVRGLQSGRGRGINNHQTGLTQASLPGDWGVGPAQQTWIIIEVTMLSKALDWMRSPGL